MTPRPRKRNNAALPPNLYVSKRGKYTSYRYRHPITKKFFGMGADKAQAIADAKQLNSLLMAGSDRVSAVMGFETLADHIDWFFKEIVPPREYKPKSLEMYRGKANLLKRRLGDRPVDSISVRDFAEIVEDQTPRAGQQLRQVAIDIFRAAIGRGFIETNPAEAANKPAYKKTRRRLKPAEFDAIFEAAPTWLQNAMLLAKLILQRRGDLSRLKFSDYRDGCLYVIQEKTEKYDTGYLKIIVGPETEHAIARCRDNVASPYLIHRKPRRKIKRDKCDHWTQITPEMISREFKEVRDGLDIFDGVPMDQRPTFHEIKALGIKTYRDQKKDPQGLAGHASEKMTNNYDSDHEEIRWRETVSN